MIVPNSSSDFFNTNRLTYSNVLLGQSATFKTVLLVIYNKLIDQFVQIFLLRTL
jgi:hypothetical protein